MLSLLFQRLESASVATSAREGFDFLAGAWLDTDDETSIYMEVSDKLLLVYCYEGDDEPSGEYYAFRRYGDDLMGRFRWFHAPIDGYFWLHIDSPNHLSGGWWMNEDLSMEQRADPEQLKKAQQINKMAWVRVPNKPTPPWARKALDALRAGKPISRPRR